MQGERKSSCSLRSRNLNYLNHAKKAEKLLARYARRNLNYLNHARRKEKLLFAALTKSKLSQLCKEKGKAPARYAHEI